ncbi:MAG: dihydroorotate dehydrogenase electron transfer subunit [Vallitaleaceae bacterium]|nr:dihydroorotate dehydrogenase electron transfer subunit [Vallitaleaceae bacterium]
MCQTSYKSKISCKIIKNVHLIDQVYEMVLDCPSIAMEAKAGQFVNLYCQHKGRLLPRPISICEIDREGGRLHLVYAILGDGTAEFASYVAGEQIEVLGPFGNGFKFDPDHEEDVLIIGGGVGTPPLVQLAKELKGKKTIVVGFRSNPYLIERLEKYGKVFITTDDGSTGFKGHVVALLEEKGLQGTIYACGPTPMLKGVKAYASKNNLSAQLSLEERMGCGFGGCVGCVTKIVADTELGFTYKKVCKDGPVFDAKEVLF